jgi:hypothetical protein
VIRMEKVLKEIDFLIGDKFNRTDDLFNQRSFDIFSDITLGFLSDISKQLLNSPFVRNYPDVVTFAFYCREANLKVLNMKYASGNKLLIGRGILFHIAPGNVPINFAYSLLAGLLTGNINIVRLPSDNFEQVNIIVEAIKKVLDLERYKLIFSKRLYLVKYDRQSSATGFFSKLCDIRIIWGGDRTIDDIRKFPISPKSTEITFSDRYSVAIINASSYLKIQDKSKVAFDFYNDTFLFDQNACTSPQTIYWIGPIEEIRVAQDIFWKNLHLILVEKKYELQPISSVDKLTMLFTQAISYGDIEIEPRISNLIWRIKNNSIHLDIDLYKCNCGYFNEVVISSLDAITSVINRKFQTICYLGFAKDELEIWVKNNKPLGVDRIVPLGRTMDFSLIWDGYDLVSSLSRRVVVS